MGVSTVMRLDRADYDAAPFDAAGIDVCALSDLGCEDEEDGFSLQARSPSASPPSPPSVSICDGQRA